MQKEIEKRVLVERRLEYRRNIHIVEAMRGLIRAEIAKYLPTYLRRRVVLERFSVGNLSGTR